MKRRIMALMLSLLMLAGTALTGGPAYAEGSEAQELAAEQAFSAAEDHAQPSETEAVQADAAADETLSVVGPASLEELVSGELPEENAELPEDEQAELPAENAELPGEEREELPAENAELPVNEQAEPFEEENVLPEEEALTLTDEPEALPAEEEAAPTEEENAGLFSSPLMAAPAPDLPLGAVPPVPADISGTFTGEVGETISILTVLDNVADAADRSILLLRVYTAAGEGIVPLVNKNNNEYTYSLGDVKVIAICEKNDDAKLITEFNCVPLQAGTITFGLELVSQEGVLASGTVTLNVPYRVNDDPQMRALPGEAVDVKANDYITPKAKLVLCDASGTPLPSETAADGVTLYYEPQPGLKLTNDGSVITVMEDSALGRYTFYYYAQEPGKNGKSFYTNDSKVPAVVSLKLVADGLYSLTDDLIEGIRLDTASTNIYDNDTLPAGERKDLAVKFYSGSRGPFEYEVTFSPQPDGTLRSTFPYGLTFHPDTGLMEYRNSYWSAEERQFGYRVFPDRNDEEEYIQAIITVRMIGLSNVYAPDTLPFGTASTIELLERAVLPNEPYTITLCNADGSAFTAPEGVTASLNSSNQLVITPEKPGMDIELYFRLDYSGGSDIASVIMHSDYIAWPDEADAPLGVEVPVNVLDNDQLPELSDIPGAVSREVVILSSRWGSGDIISPDPDGYCYPDRETKTDPVTGDDVTEWSIRVKIDNDGNALATIYRQKKSGFTYSVRYLDDVGNELAAYKGECTIYPVLNYTRQELHTIPPFDPGNVSGYDGDPDSSNKWQVVKGDYYGEDFSVRSDDGVIIAKNVAATDTENLFDIILDVRTPVSWSEFLELGTCRLQNGNSDNSSNRVLLYSSLSEAEEIRQLYLDTGASDIDIVKVQVLFYHDDWQLAGNIVHAATKYVVKPSGGNFYLYYQDPTPDHDLHSEKDQSRKIMEGNFYYVDITALYDQYDFAIHTIVPDTVTDPMGENIIFKDFVYNPEDSASYDGGIVTWDVGALYNGAFEDLIEMTIDGKQVYMHQYDLIYRIELDTGADGFVPMTPYDTNGQTTLTYDEDGENKSLDFNIPQVQGRAFGDLTVVKKLGGNAADSTKEFAFTVTLGDAEINGVYGDMTFTDGVSTFSLKGGESRTAKALPAGTAFTVTEADCSADGYVTEKSGDTGVIAAGQELTAIFTNTKNITPVPEPEPKTGSLTVTKKLAGNAAEADRAFAFTVTLDNAEINGVFGDMTFTDGVSTFSLKGGESKTAEGLPEGTAFTVTEEDCSADGYVTEKSGDTGVITDGETLEAVFTNTKDVTPTPPDEPDPEPVPPKTGDDSHLGLWIAILAVCAAGVVCVVILAGKKKKKD